MLQNLNKILMIPQSPICHRDHSCRSTKHFLEASNVSGKRSMAGCKIKKHKVLKMYISRNLISHCKNQWGGILYIAPVSTESVSGLSSWKTRFSQRRRDLWSSSCWCEAQNASGPPLVFRHGGETLKYMVGWSKIWRHKWKKLGWSKKHYLYHVCFFLRSKRMVQRLWFNYLAVLGVSTQLMCRPQIHWILLILAKFCHISPT